MTKTINLTGAEVAVTGLDGAHAHITNMGADIIYAAKSAGISPGADGVVPIPAGNGNTLRGISGAVYLLGTGSVLVQSDDYVQHPSFRNSTASGGSGVDDVARAALGAHEGNTEIHVTAAEKADWNGKAGLSDIPTSLPANGGNADTVGGLPVSDLVQNMGVWSGENIRDLILANNSGCVFIGADVTGMPLDNTYWFGFLNNINGLKQLTVYQLDGYYAGYIAYNNTNGQWSAWKSFADGGNAASVGAYTEAKIAALEARIAALEGGTT